MTSNLKEPGRLKELDGLRSVAAAVVILSHVSEGPNSSIPRFIAPFCDGATAVLIFFVLSGFVITRMLRNELARTGTIAMGQFYLRRALRIWPVSYAYIAFVTGCALLHLAVLQPAQIAIAAAHMWNYVNTIINENPTSQGHVIFGHFWSLALEEQFYWTWPLALILLRRRASQVLVVLILIMPIVRVISYVLFPYSRGYLGEMFHTALDPIAVGAWIALNEDWLKSRVARLSPVLFYGNIAFLLLICPVLTAHFRGFWDITYGHTLVSASAGLLVFALAYGPETPVARLMRTAPFQFGGRISFSLYVWQQLFTLPGTIFPQPSAIAIILACAAATASYYLIERPFLKLKQSLPKPHTAPQPHNLTEPSA